MISVREQHSKPPCKEQLKKTSRNPIKIWDLCIFCKTYFTISNPLRHWLIAHSAQLHENSSSTCQPPTEIFPVLQHFCAPHTVSPTYPHQTVQRIHLYRIAKDAVISHMLFCDCLINYCTSKFSSQCFSNSVSASGHTIIWSSAKSAQVFQDQCYCSCRRNRQTFGLTWWCCPCSESHCCHRLQEWFHHIRPKLCLRTWGSRTPRAEKTF